MKKFITLFLLLVYSDTLFADNIDILVEQSKDITKQERIANDLWLLSISGSAKATSALGWLYIQGKGIPKDCKKGILLLFESTINDNSNKAPYYKSFLKISELFSKGICVHRNLKKAHKYKRMYIKYSNIHKISK